MIDVPHASSTDARMYKRTRLYLSPAHLYLRRTFLMSNTLASANAIVKKEHLSPLLYVRWTGQYRIADVVTHTHVRRDACHWLRTSASDILVPLGGPRQKRKKRRCVRELLKPLPLARLPDERGWDTSRNKTFSQKNIFPREIRGYFDVFANAL